MTNRRSLYIKWKNMRGLRSPEWDSFFEFSACVSSTYIDGTKLFRVDRALPFGPDNYRWVSVEDAMLAQNNPNFKDACTTGGCKICGQVTRFFKANPREYCSRECQAAAQRAKHKEGCKPSECVLCGALFTQDGGRRKYCTPECAEFAKLAKDEAAAKKDAISSTKKKYGVYTWALCKVCGKRMRLRPSDVDKGKKYCSRVCYGKAVGLRQRGELHHNWKGGVTKVTDRIRKSDLYAEWRKKVFERDEYTCQSCFDVGGKLRAHHVVAYKDAPKLRLKVTNGVTLCAECHRKWHVFDNKGLFEGLEKKLQTKAIERFKAAGFYTFNVHGGAMQTAGVPDVILCCFGLFAAVEFKVFPNFLTPLQKMHARAIKNSGGACFMARSEDDVERIIDEMTRLALGEG